MKFSIFNSHLTFTVELRCKILVMFNLQTLQEALQQEINQSNLHKFKKIISLEKF